MLSFSRFALLMQFEASDFLNQIARLQNKTRTIQKQFDEVIMKKYIYI